MRYVRASFVAIMVLLVSGLLAQPARASDVSFGFFYSNLSPHGSWLVSGQYGRVWQPAAYAPGWNPYLDGHWVYTDVGWTWVSDYSWGDVCYHYGTWYPDPALGWVWVPGYTWAPAWVVFRTGPDYIGWAPVAPGFSIGASFSFGSPAAGPFMFVSSGNFLAPSIRGYVVPESRTRVIINNTRVINNLVVERNVVVNRGPDVRVVERASGRKVREIPIERVPRAAPGSRVVRDQLAVDPQRVKHGLRAADPVSTKEPVPQQSRTQSVRGKDARDRQAVRDRQDAQDRQDAWGRQDARGRQGSRRAEPQTEAQRSARSDGVPAHGRAPTARPGDGRSAPRRQPYVAPPQRPQPQKKVTPAPPQQGKQKGKRQRPVRHKPPHN